MLLNLFIWMFSTCCKKDIKNSKIQEHSWNLAGT